MKKMAFFVAMLSFGSVASGQTSVVKIDQGVQTPKLSIGSSFNADRKLYIYDNTYGNTDPANPRFFATFRNDDPVGYVIQDYIAGVSGGKLEIGFASSDYALGNPSIAQYANRGTLISRNSSGLILRSTPADGYVYDGITFQAGSGSITPERMRITGDGNVGIGTTAPHSKLQVTNGDVYVDNPYSGIILKSTNGYCWRVTIDNNGNFVRTQISCP
jgi:hypothetical protein